MASKWFIPVLPKISTSLAMVTKATWPFLARLVRPKHIVPIGGDVRHMMLYAKMTKELNFRPDQVSVLTEGQSIILDNKVVKEGPKYETKMFMSMV